MDRIEIAGVALLVIVAVLILAFRTNAPISLGDAIAAAKRAPECAPYGTVGSTGVYNANSETWWIDFTPSSAYAQAGCNPACVVSASSTAELNWRCTGFGTTTAPY